ncbi:MAG: 4Fe-4S binding protein [Clostridia bacterium]
MSSRKTRLVTFLTDRRRWIQGMIGLGVYALMSFMGLSLWWILGIGAVTGIVFGKVFCRWACPIGFIMEIITGLGGDKGKFQQMYQYHKLGCPIAWISGALNKQSIFRIEFDESSCTKCGLCDKTCYLSTLEPAKFSLFRKDKERPGLAFACSKCLVCVSACPTGSLSYKPVFSFPSIANR